MHMLFINGLLSDKIIQALCWTLLHSLWQGLLLAIIAAIIIMITRKSAPELRYKLFTWLFILFIATTGFTFLLQIFSIKKTEPEIAEMSRVILSINNIPDNSNPATTIHPTFSDALLQYFNTHASVIVTVWFILFSVKLVRVLTNLGYVQRVRHYKTFAPSIYWKQRITELAQNLHIQHSIILLESAFIKVPMVVGLLKPAILVPLGLLSNLPPDQIEAVLLHELAHIRRKDYLVNLLQSFAEVAFFFNPAVLWISSLIREERENCCDDVAIGGIKNKNQFIHALVAFQEYAMRTSNTSTAIAFAGQKKYLLNRVKRIIYKENKKLNAMEKGIFILSIVAISLIGFVSIKHTPAQKVKSSIAALPGKNILDTVPAKQNKRLTDTLPGPVEFKNLSSVMNKEGDSETRTIIATDKGGKKYKLIMKSNQPMELYVNDEEIPAEELGNYEKLIASIEYNVELRQRKDMDKMKKDQAEQSEKMMQLEAERRELMKKLNAIDAEQAKMNHEKAQKFNDHEWEDAAKLNLLNEKLLKMRNEDLQLLSLKQNLNLENDFQQKLFNEKIMQNELDEKYQKELLNEKLSMLHNEGPEQQQQRTYILIDPIIEDLAEEKIIPPHQEDVSFELNNKTLIVNGKKQSADVLERF
jgi:bla regulator protein BlaR1